MLVKYRSKLIPEDTPRDMIDFVIDHSGTKERYDVGLVFPTERYTLYIENVYFIAQSYHAELLNVSTQITSRAQQIYLYAWNHVQYIIPSTQRRRKKHEAGWLRKGALDVITPELNSWAAKDLREWTEGNHDVN